MTATSGLHEPDRSDRLTPDPFATLPTKAADSFVKAWSDLMAHVDEQIATLAA